MNEDPVKKFQIIIRSVDHKDTEIIFNVNVSKEEINMEHHPSFENDRKIKDCVALLIHNLTLNTHKDMM